MRIKKAYKSLLGTVERAPEKIESTKTKVAELRAIRKKGPIYRDIQWSKEQKEEFDSFWLENYGRRISNRWHKLYQAMSGEFCVNYLPEMLFSTKIEPMMNDRVYARVFEDKSILETLSSGCECIVPETIFVRSAAQYYDADRFPISETEAINRMRYAGRVVLKPTTGSSSGKGICFLDMKDEFGPDDKAALESMGQDFIVQKCIKPHPVFAALNASSINTIRLITYICDDKIFHAPIALRIGRSKSNVDNIHAGGLVVGVKDNGQLLEYAYELGYGDQSIKYSNHPDRNVRFADVILPQVPSVIRAGCQLHGRFPHIGIISWDFTVDQDDNVVLVEANIKGQSVWFPQIVHGKGIFCEQTKSVLQRLMDAEGR